MAMIKKTITINKKLNDELNDLSQEIGLTISDLIRRAIELLVEKYKKEKE